MRITIVYDNAVREAGLRADWGFSCLIEDPGIPQILFDTGARGSILLHNMERLELDPGAIDIIIISHAHQDHSGGLSYLLAENDSAEIYLPASVGGVIPGRKVTRVGEGLEVCDKVYSTGELKGIEQSLALRTDRGVFVVTGCSHPGVGEIIDVASTYGEVVGIVGGLHGFSDFERLQGLALVSPCHCTQHKAEIKRLYPDECVECGAGLVLEL